MDAAERAGWPLRDAALVVVLGAAVLVPSLFTRDPWNPDEPRYAEIARAMVATGNYWVPHLNGEIYPDKPALFFWLTAGLMRLGLGVGSGRVVAAVAAAATLLLVYWLGRRLHDRQVGLWAAAITATTLLFAWMGKCGVLDAPLTLCVVGAICCGERALAGAGRRPGAWWLGFYAAIGFGVLFKGPVALAVPVLVALAYGVARRAEVRKGGWWHLAGVALMLAVVAAWLVPALLKGGEAYANEIVVGQTAQRFTKHAAHRKPWFFFLVTWPFYFLPWSLLVPLALVSAVKAARGGRERQAWLPALWVVVIFVFFSIPSGKRERYILPIVPAVALLVARYIVRVAEGELPWPRWHAWLWRVTLVLGVAVAVTLATVALSPERMAARLELSPGEVGPLRALLTPARVGAAVATSAALVAAAFYASWRLRDPTAERRRALLAVGAALLISLVADLAVIPVFDHFKSGRGLIDDGRPFLDAADEILLYEDDFEGVYNLFAQRLCLPIARSPEDLAAATAAPRRIAVIAREKHFRQLPKLPLHVAVRRRVGSKRMLLLTNWEPGYTPPPP